MLRRRDLMGGAVAITVPLVAGSCGDDDAAPAEVPLTLEAAVQWIIDTPREELPARALAELARGLEVSTLRAANLAACCVTFPYADHPNLGGAFHAVPAIDVGRHLGDVLDGDDALVGTLLALDELKGSIEAFAIRNDGPPLPAAPAAAAPSSADAAAVLDEALATFDTELADAAAISLYRADGLAPVLEAVRAYAPRENHSDYEHRTIHAFHLARLFATIPAEPIELALRALVRAVSGPPDGDDLIWESARSAIAGAPPSWDEGTSSQASAEAMWSTFRTGDVDLSIDAVLSELASGGAQSAWDAVFMSAAEVVLRSETNQLFDTTHALTGAASAFQAYRESQVATTRLVSLLVAAGRVADRYSRVTSSLDLTALTGPSDASIDSVFARLETDVVGAAGELVGYLDAGGDLDAWLARARQNMLSRANNIHDIKYPEAVFGVFSERLPAWRRTCLAASLAFIPRDSDLISGAYENIMAALTS